MFMKASDIVGDDGRPNQARNTGYGSPARTPGSGGFGRNGYGFSAARPNTGVAAYGRPREEESSAERPATTGELGMAGALPTESRRSMLQRQAELQRRRRAARRTGGFMATSRPSIDGPDAPRSPMQNPQFTRNIPQFSAPRYNPSGPSQAFGGSSMASEGKMGGSMGGKTAEREMDPPMNSPSSGGMSLAEVIRERERAKQRDARIPSGAGMTGVERELARKGISATYDPGVPRSMPAAAEPPRGGGGGGGPSAAPASAASLDLSDMNRFLTEPTPRSAGVVECYIHRFKSGMNKLFPVYHVFMKDGDRFLMAAKKRSKQRTSNYLISSNKDDMSKGANFMGKLRSNFVGTEFTVYDSGVNPKDAGYDMSRARNELALVTYASNVLGSKGPRKMKVCVPRVNDRNERVEFKPTGKDGCMIARLKANDLSQMVFMINKPPRWNDAVGAYVLNFNGRVTMASVKNFQLVDPEDQENVLLQFGRVGKDVFNMDYRWPLSPLQAFAICLSSFDYKIACE